VNFTSKAIEEISAEIIALLPMHKRTDNVIDIDD